MEVFKITIKRSETDDRYFEIYKEDGVEWTGDSENDVEEKIAELLQTIPGKMMKPIKDMSYIVEVFLGK